MVLLFVERPQASWDSCDFPQSRCPPHRPRKLFQHVEYPGVWRWCILESLDVHRRWGWWKCEVRQLAAPEWRFVSVQFVGFVLVIAFLFKFFAGNAGVIRFFAAAADAAIVVVLMLCLVDCLIHLIGWLMNWLIIFLLIAPGTYKWYPPSRHVARLCYFWGACATPRTKSL